jgi:transketolase
METIDCKKIAQEVRKEVLKMHFLSNQSHIGSALSCSDILAVLYFKIMNIDSKKPFIDNRDRFILSKSHAVSALYATLALKGFFSKDILKTYCQDGTKLPGHATRGTIAGIEASTGALGHGLPMGAGMAFAGKRDNKKHRVFVLISDGECDEGSTWEAALFAGHHKLDNLTVIVDRNRIQAFGKTEEVLNLEPLKDKWASFGWQTKEVDGHNPSEIEKSLSSLPIQKDKPSVIIANTTKGKGISFMENKVEWHYKSPNKEEYNLAARELK